MGRQSALVTMPISVPSKSGKRSYWDPSWLRHPGSEGNDLILGVRKLFTYARRLLADRLAIIRHPASPTRLTGS